MVAATGHSITLSNQYRAGLFTFDPDGQPDEPRGHIPAREAAGQVIVDGAAIYAACGAGGLLLVQAPQPTNPQLQARIAADDTFLKMRLDSAKRLLCAEREAGLSWLDVSSSPPRLLASLPATDPRAHITDVAVDGNLHIACERQASDYRARIFDLSSGLPVERSSIDAVHALQLRNKTAYALHTRDGLKIYNCHNPAAPSLRGSASFSDDYAFRTLYDTAIHGDRLYVASRRSLSAGIYLYIFDISDPDDPKSVNFTSGNLLSIGGLAVLPDGRLLARELNGDLRLVDARDASNVHLVATLGKNVRQLAVNGDRFATINSSSGRLQIWQLNADNAAEELHHGEAGRYGEAGALYLDEDQILASFFQQPLIIYAADSGERRITLQRPAEHGWQAWDPSSCVQISTSPSAQAFACPQTRQQGFRLVVGITADN